MRFMRNRTYLERCENAHDILSHPPDIAYPRATSCHGMEHRSCSCGARPRPPGAILPPFSGEMRHGERVRLCDEGPPQGGPSQARDPEGDLSLVLFRSE